MKVNPETIPNLVKDFLASFPKAAQDVKQDSSEVLQTFLRFCLDKTELLTREEFEVQSKVLEKTRAKLEMLEKRVQDLESSQSNKA